MLPVFIEERTMADEMMLNGETSDNNGNIEAESCMVTLSEAKAYLRVDSSYEDSLICSLVASAEMLCKDVARLSAGEWDQISNYQETQVESISIRNEEKSKGEIQQMKELLRVGVMYALGYLYEHREEADHHDLVITLRNLLFAIREGVF